MKKYQLLLLIILMSVSSIGQNIIPNISARVDTSKVAIKQVYHLYKIISIQDRTVFTKIQIGMLMRLSIM